MTDKNNRKARLRLIIFLLCTLAAILFGIHTYHKYQERKEAIRTIEERNLQRQNVSEEEEDSGVLEYEGKTYRRNNAVKAILCLGVDTKGVMEKQNVSGAGGQSDMILLVAQDTIKETAQLLLIPRDTMTEIEVFDFFGNPIGYDKQQLTLAFAYGDGREESCRLMEEAVSKFLYGLEIDGYFAANISTISLFNDAVGGIEVTVEDESISQAYPQFVMGEKILLEGEDAARYVRHRDTEVTGTSHVRLHRQKGYLKSYVQTAKEAYQKDNDLIIRLVNLVEEYVLTNLNKDQYMKMGLSFLNSPHLLSDGDVLSIPGTLKETQLYEEFYPDMDEVKKIVIDMFYKESN